MQHDPYTVADTKVVDPCDMLPEMDMRPLIRRTSMLLQAHSYRPSHGDDHTLPLKSDDERLAGLVLQMFGGFHHLV